MNLAPETAEERLARLEAVIDTLGNYLEARLGSIAQELRRAEARDERAAGSLNDIYRRLREQDLVLADLKDKLVNTARN